MLSDALLLTHLESIKSILIRYKFIDFINVPNTKRTESNKYSKAFFEISQDGSYETIYSVAMQNLDYDFLLLDGSFLQFSISRSRDKPSIRYSYFQNPKIGYMNYDKFCKEYGDILDSDEMQFEYEIFIEGLETNYSAMAVRYDYSESDMKLLHEVSHMHFNENNDIRLPCSIILTPVKFVLFILNSFFHEQFIEYYRYDDYFRDFSNTAKNSCISVDSSLFNKRDYKFLFLI